MTNLGALPWLANAAAGRSSALDHHVEWGASMSSAAVCGHEPVHGRGCARFGPARPSRCGSNHAETDPRNVRGPHVRVASIEVRWGRWQWRAATANDRECVPRHHTAAGVDVDLNARTSVPPSCRFSGVLRRMSPAAKSLRQVELELIRRGVDNCRGWLPGITWAQLSSSWKRAASSLPSTTKLPVFRGTAPPSSRNTGTVLRNPRLRRR